MDYIEKNVYYEEDIKAHCLDRQKVRKNFNFCKTTCDEATVKLIEKGLEL